MSSNKIIRTICYFSDNPTEDNVAKVNNVRKLLEDKGYLIQTTRLCTTLDNLGILQSVTNDKIDYTSIGAISYDEVEGLLPSFLKTNNLAFNIDLAKEEIDRKHAELLFEIIRHNPSKTFDFTFTFNNANSSPYFPSANYEISGFALGLQPTNLTKDCDNLNDWLSKMKICWEEIADLFTGDPEFLGIDSSIAPIGGGEGSFVNFLKKLNIAFEHSATTDIYTRITKYIKQENPKPIGLCGMMLPCLEDDELAAEYDLGNFTIERNVFLSLHSGLGIDTYPIGIDEKPERVVEILKLMQALSNKYQKPLSARFVSDGKAKIGTESNYQNQYLADCHVRAF